MEKEIICENCNSEHTGNYGSGRFCSQKCSRSYSTKDKRDSINEKLSRTFRNNLRSGIKTGFINPVDNVSRECPICKNVFEVKPSSRKKTCSNSCASKKSWRDGAFKKVNWSKVNLDSYSSGKNYIGGGLTKWIQYKDIKVQGTYEYRACEILDAMKERNEIKEWWYSITRIKYRHKDNVERTYIIDFTFENLDGSKKHIEVKGWIEDTDRVKWEETRKQGLDLDVWMHEDLFD
jgi:hypothetical protein